MYIAKKRIQGRMHYYIRDSFKQEGRWCSRDLFNLGTDPGRYIVYPGGNAYYIHEEVADSIVEFGIEPEFDEVDELFWPFVDVEIKRKLEGFRRRENTWKARAKLSARAKDALRQETHLFDKRRIHFLRLGRMNQGYIGRMPVSLYQWVRHKSRDEIEQRLMVMEEELRPTELRCYVYVIFDLQRFFTEILSKEMPQTLDSAKVEQYFLDELCRLNRDASFWGAEIDTSGLHEHLVRYAIMFFDYDYPPGNFAQRYVQDFINRHRFYHPPVKKPALSVDEASKVFKIKTEALEKMTRKGLTRLYYRRARKLHPDTGGEHEQFIKLTEAYQSLLRRKGRS